MHSLIRAFDIMQKKMGSYATFSLQIVHQEESIMGFFLRSLLHCFTRFEKRKIAFMLFNR